MNPSSGSAPAASPPSSEENRPLHVVHLVSSLQVGGMEQFVLRLAAALQARGHRAGILAVTGGPLLDAARAQGLGVDVLRSKHPALRIAEATALLARRRPDVAHAHNPTSLLFAVPARFAAGSRVVMTGHGYQPGMREPTSLEWRNTDAVVAVSDAAAGVLQERSPALKGRVRVIRNGVEFRAASRTRAEVRRELELGEGLAGIIVARIDGRKGHETLLRALASLGTAAPTLLVAGDGAERARMEAVAAELGLADQVRFLGFREDIPDLLAASDFFVLPSLMEAMPLSVLEAMSHGLPIVATAVGGIPEVVTDGEHGLLVPPDDPDALAKALGRILTEPDLRARLGEAGQRRAREEFSFSAMVQTYETLYREVRAGRGMAG